MIYTQAYEALFVPLFSLTIKTNRAQIFRQARIRCSPRKITNSLFISVYGAYYIRLFAGIYQHKDKAHRAKTVCVFELVETHVWPCPAGWWGLYRGWAACPPTLGRPGWRGRTWGWDCWRPDWCRSPRTFLTEEIEDDHMMMQWQVNSSPPDQAGQKLTEGEKEGVEADVSSCRNLRDQPLCYAADGHWKRPGHRA